MRKILDSKPSDVAIKLEIHPLRSSGDKGRKALIGKLAELTMKEHFWKISLKSLGAEKGIKFMFKGCNMSEIKKCFKTEFDMNVMFDKWTKLVEIKAELEKFLTDDQKAKAAFENLTKIMSKV